MTETENKIWLKIIDTHIMLHIYPIGSTAYSETLKEQRRLFDELKKAELT